MSIAAIITEGIGPGGSVKYIMTLGYDIGSIPPPPVVTGIASGHLNITSGELEFLTISGNANLEIKGPRFELVIES